MTFTILAVDEAGAHLAAATASYSLAVGNAVPSVRPGVGAVASQSWTNRALRSAALDALADGVEPGPALDSLAAIDDGIELRQLGLIAADGSAAGYTGTQCSAWAGHLIGDGYVILGNLLAGPDVLGAMAASLDGSRPAGGAGETYAVGDWVLAALAAGDAAGGDIRGRQSAALQIGSARLYSHAWPPELLVDLRVDDAPDPVGELRRMMRLDGAVRPGS